MILYIYATKGRQSIHVTSLRVYDDAVKACMAGLQGNAPHYWWRGFVYEVVLNNPRVAPRVLREKEKTQILQNAGKI